jgi:hypothetical protein
VRLSHNVPICIFSANEIFLIGGMRLCIAVTFYMYFLLSPAAKKPEVVCANMTLDGIHTTDPPLSFWAVLRLTSTLSRTIICIVTSPLLRVSARMLRSWGRLEFVCFALMASSFQIPKSQKSYQVVLGRRYMWDNPQHQDPNRLHPTIPTRLRIYGHQRQSPYPIYRAHLCIRPKRRRQTRY